MEPSKFEDLPGLEELIDSDEFEDLPELEDAMIYPMEPDKKQILVVKLTRTIALQPFNIEFYIPPIPEYHHISILPKVKILIPM